ncbi:MAG: response regulator [Aeoliella sp.]
MTPIVWVDMLSAPPGRPLATISPIQLPTQPAQYGDNRLSGELRNPCVLIVDQSAESREVLRALLERSGRMAIEASRPDEAAEVTERERPQLIVVDADSDRSAGGEATLRLHRAARRTDTPIVVLGQVGRVKTPLAPGEWVAKPYHYGDLLRRIEDVLEQRRAA